jgi:hypothetical protein
MVDNVQPGDALGRLPASDDATIYIPLLTTSASHQPERDEQDVQTWSNPSTDKYTSELLLRPRDTLEPYLPLMMHVRGCYTHCGPRAIAALEDAHMYALGTHVYICPIGQQSDVRRGPSGV